MIFLHFNIQIIYVLWSLLKKLVQSLIAQFAQQDYGFQSNALAIVKMVNNIHITLIS